MLLCSQRRKIEIKNMKVFLRKEQEGQVLQVRLAINSEL